ncbi:mRNA cap guanine-N7 methyltransferase [Neocloeon triangulifer]|uniref:mRNA cap guanine-N7 methyltransferase n=1 Tax=Neocloeon triangulifer TaxID=2078957 RepID=UPI00286F7056|nr:mRNA cap guanine-N7 methyltransferase [Neocloeon triangulifer]
MAASMPSLLDEDPQGRPGAEEPANSPKFLPDLSDSDSNEEQRGKKSPPEPEVGTLVPPPGAAVEVVASHYNAIENAGLEARKETRIFYMRNFNNWVKSMQIGEYLKRIRGKGTSAIRVLDLGCGKGGDLLKWMRGSVSHVTCADVAAVSMEHCESRYSDMKKKQRGPLFSAEFITCDCTKELLKDKFVDKQAKFNLVSCQFAFHYCFESLQQANCMMQNAAEKLEIGGYFIGTIPNAYEIVKRHKAVQKDTFGNEVYQITMQESSSGYPLFGAMYNFHLQDVVECPEFLVHFPTLVKLADKHGLKLVEKMTFPEFYDKTHQDGRFLLQKINALETYPPGSEQTLLGKDEDYDHAREHLKRHPRAQSLGTLSMSEWEATSLYLVFAFQKCTRQLNLDDYPEAPKKKSKK